MENIWTVLDLLSMFIILFLYIAFSWGVSKLKPPRMFFLLDYVCYKPPFSKPGPAKELENQPRLYTTSNQLENVVFEMVDELLKKSKIEIEDIRVLVCVFNGSSAVSLSSMIMKRYKLKKSISSYDLHGKGSNIGLTTITLVKKLLQVNHDGCALVVTSEELPESHHIRIDDPNNSFLPEYRPSGAAILLSNRTSDSFNSKYKFVETYNAHVAIPKGPSFNPETQVAVTVIDDPTSASDKVVESIAKYLYLYSMRWKWKCFSLAHESGEPMVAAVERNPKVQRGNLEADRMLLSWFGYEPISIMWYRLAFMESKGFKVPKDNWLLQRVFWTDWSEFKGTMLVWQAIGDIDRGEKKVKPLIFTLFGDVGFSHIFAK